MKSEAPFFSIKPSGSFAKLLVASNWKNKPYLSKTHRPGGSATPDQLAVRARFTDAKNAWKLLTDFEKEEYNEVAEPLGITGYNLFIKEYSPDMLKTAVINLNNDDIKALPSNVLTLVTPSSPSKRIIPFFIDIAFSAFGAVYTNVASECAISSFLSSPYKAFLTLKNNAEIGSGKLSNFFADTDGSYTLALRTPDIVGYSDLISNEVEMEEGASYIQGAYGSPLTLELTNGSAGDFESGDPANVLKITVFYVEV